MAAGSGPCPTRLGARHSRNAWPAGSKRPCERPSYAQTGRRLTKNMRRLRAIFCSICYRPRENSCGVACSFIDMIAPAGAVNGLAQTVLKMTVPGMPDFFQGTEFWDFSLVDPDNRRPVDYGARREALAARETPAACQASWRDGRIKQAVMQKVLEFRRQQPGLFACGDYLPITVQGDLRDNFVAFARQHEGAAVVVVVPRLSHRLLAGAGHLSLDPERLRDNRLVPPESLRGRRLRPLLGGGDTVSGHPDVPLPSVLGDFPVAVLYAD